MGLEKLAAAFLCGGIGFVLGSAVPDISKKLLDWKSARKNRKYDIGEPSVFVRLLYGALAGVLFGLAAASLPAWKAAEAAMISLLCLIITFVDNRVRIIPNETLLIFIPLAVAWRITDGGLRGALGGFGAVGITVLLLLISFAIVRKKESVGAGDVKFLMVCSFAAGIPGVLVMLAAMGVSILVFLLGSALLKRIGMDSYFPMGGYISAGILAVFFADKLTLVMELLTGGV